MLNSHKKQMNTQPVQGNNQQAIQTVSEVGIPLDIINQKVESIREELLKSKIFA
jgi:negative regulator of replication initiation